MIGGAPRAVGPLLVGVALASLPGPAPVALDGQEPGGGAFFATAEPAHLALSTDLGSIEAGRLGNEALPVHPGALRYPGLGSDTLERAVEVRARGDSRRYLCDFPPLLIRFPDGPAEGPVFGGHGELHHVGHCRNRDPRFEAHALREYLAYRLWSELGAVALRARPARIEYRDTGGRIEVGSRWAFLVEDRSLLARRFSGRFVDDPDSLELDRIAHGEAATLALFQYMIGNTDWAIETLHNVMILRTADGVLHPVPFDFDFSGLVDAPYARPRGDLGLSSVRERAYVGACRSDAEHRAVVSRMRRARPRVLAAADALPGLGPEVRSDVRAYLTSFFDWLDDPAAALRTIAETCR